MTSFASFLDWSADPLPALSSDIDALVPVTSASAASLDDALPAGWIGQAATAAQSSLASTSALAQGHADDVRRLADAVGEATTSLVSALRERDAILARAAAHEVTVGRGGVVSDAASRGASGALPTVPTAADAAARQALVDEIAASLSGVFGRAVAADAALAAGLGPVFRSAGRVRDRGSADEPAQAPGTPVDDYRVGPPTRPSITWDEDFQWGTGSATAGDYLSREKWMAMMEAGRLRGDLPDGVAMYEHYWSNTGSPVTFDYERAVDEDAGIARSVGHKMDETSAAVNSMIAAGKTGDFDITGPATVTTDYPTTENWQKAIGGHQQWSSAHVSVKDGTVTMTVTVHGEDHYNFNRGQADIGSGAKDSENGRFTELGWAKPFDSSGTVTRTVTWPVGGTPPVTDLHGGTQKVGR